MKRLKPHHIKRASRHPFAVPFITFLVLGSLIGIGLIIAKATHRLHPAKGAQIVLISHDHIKQIVPTRATTVGSLLQKLNIQLGEGDVVEPAATTKIDQDQFRINIYRAVPVAVTDTGHRSFTFSAATTPRSIAAQAGAKLYPDDIVSTEPTDDFLRTGTIGAQVTVSRATPVNLNLYGTPLAIRTHAATVGDLVKQKHIILAKDDQLIPAKSTPLTPNTLVFVVRNGVKIETVEEDIAMPVQQIQDATLAYGTSAIRQQGNPGHRVVTYQVQLQNGVATGRKIIQEVITQTTVTQILVVGTSLSGIKGDMALAGISPGDYEYVDYIVSRESGWCPTKAQGQRDCPPIPTNPNTPNGYGLCQSTPGSKMASAGSDWQTNPVTQLRWCSSYAISRYGSWGAAYTHWLAYKNW